MSTTQTNNEAMAQKDLEAAIEVRRQKQIKEPAMQVAMPFGKVIDARPFIEARPKFKARGELLTQFEQIIKSEHYDPKQYVYAWPVAEDEETKARIRLGLYIKVTKDEINGKGQLVTHEGPDDKDVRWYRHILVKIPMEYAQELYEEPKARALQRLVKHEDWTREQANQIGHQVGAEVSIEKSFGR